MENRKRAPSVAEPDLHRTWTEAVARQLLDEWTTSGESLTAFARRKEVLPQRLSWWRKRLAAAPGKTAMREASPVATPSFIPVTVRGGAYEPAAAVELGGAVRVELRTLDVASAAWVAALVRALGGAP